MKKISFLFILFIHVLYGNFEISSIYESLELHIHQACSHWNEARKLIDLETILENDCPSILKFYTTGELFAVNISGQYMIYSSIWKAANNAIRHNMIYNEGLSQNSSYQLFPSSLKVDVKKELRKYSRQWNVKHSNSFHIIRNIKQDTNIKAFTFVRDPLDHFISGLNEYHHLTRIYSERRNENYNIYYLKQDIYNILNLHKIQRHKWILRHLYAMTGSLLQVIKIHYIGTLNNINNDWNNLQSYYQIQLQSFNSTLGLHPYTSNDKYQIYNVYNALIIDEPKYKLVICHILYLDYITFNYTLPIDCKL